MGYLIRMPQMGMSMEQGTVVEWMLDEGDSAEEDETIAVVESEKAANDVDAREDGVLRWIHVPEGGTVEPGDPMGIFAGPNEDISDMEDELEEASSSADGSESAETEAVESASATSSSSPSIKANASDVRATPGAKQLAGEENVDLTAVEGTGPQGAVVESDVEEHLSSSTTVKAADVRSTPGAKRLAGEENVDLTAVEGTGPQGAVTEDDVEDYLASSSGTAEGAPRTVAESRQLSGMQRTIGERLSRSYQEAVHVTLNRSFQTDAIADVRSAADAASAKVSITDLLIKVVGKALQDHPELNALFEDGTHDLIEEVNVGVAVDVEDGLVTPVVSDVANRTVENVNESRGTVTERVLSGDYAADILSGGTFTITNLGMFGIDDFDPIINPPQVAILGVGRIRDDGTMTLSLSFDHRVANGADAARFLDSLVDVLTDVTALARFFDADLELDEGLNDRNLRIETASGFAGRYRTAYGDVRFDEPEDIGGDGSAPSPVDHLLGALGSCLSLSLRQMARRDEVEVGEICCDVAGSPEHGPIESVKIELELETDADSDSVDKIVTKAERSCYVARSLSEDLSVSLEWTRS